MTDPNAPAPHTPIERIVVEYDAAHGKLTYDLVNTNRANALQRLELAKHYIFADLQREDVPPEAAPHDHV